MQIYRPRRNTITAQIVETAVQMANRTGKPVAIQVPDRGLFSCILPNSNQATIATCLDTITAMRRDGIDTLVRDPK